jgi:outer membrane protein TolC
MRFGLLRGTASFTAVVGFGLCLTTTHAADVMPLAPLALETAVTDTLERSPGVQVQSQRVLQAASAVTSASGQFDFFVFSRFAETRDTVPLSTAVPTLLNGFVDKKTTDTSSVTLGGAQQFRNGIQIRPTTTVVETGATTDSFKPEGRSNVSLAITVPLARGWGRDATGANEQAAKSILATTREAARHNVAERVARTTAAYWATLASAQNLEILRESEKRALALSNQLQDLVKAGEIEAAQLEEARADLLRRRGEVVGATLGLTASWQRLATAMGLPSEQMQAMPALAASFPVVPADVLKDETVGGRYVGQALTQRGDYRAALQARTTDQIFLKRAKNDVLPGVDLELRGGYAGLQSNVRGSTFFEPLSQGVRGGSGEVALQFDWPVPNRIARGELSRRRALLRETELNTEELALVITSETLLAVATLRANAEQYVIAQDTVAAFSTVLANIRRKVSSGEASVTTLVQNEDRFVQARQALITAARNYASAITELRRVTGTLITEGDGRYLLDMNALLAVPVIGSTTP